MAEEVSSRFIAFFDECGDHSLEKIDRDFPLFVPTGRSERMENLPLKRKRRLRVIPETAFRPRIPSPGRCIARNTLAAN